MKCFRLLLSLLLLFGGPSGLSAREAGPAAGQLSMEHLAVPKALGKVEGRFLGNSNRWIILIQDIHGHFGAQENIAAIVDHLNAVYGIDTAGVEGGWGETSFSKSWGLPSSREKQMLARSLMEDEHLTGPAYAALFSRTPIHLIGMENPDLYERNRKLYLDYLHSQDSVHEALQSAEKRLVAEKKETYRPELLNFDEKLVAFRDGKDAEAFLPYLIALSSEKNIDLEDLDQLTLFRQILEMEKNLDEEKLKGEADRLLEEFKRKRLSLEELLKSGLIPEEKIQHYPAARHYLEILRLQESLDYHRFFLQADRAVERMKDALMSAPEERRLDNRWIHFQAAKKIMQLQATPATLATYRQAALAVGEEVAKMNLEGAFKTGLDFYEVAQKRDRTFFDATQNHPALKNENMVMIAGGFHSEGITARLREAGISHFLITPALGDTPPDLALYHERLTDNIPSSETLSAVQNRFFLTAFDEGFARGVLVLERERNIMKAKQAVLQRIFQNTGGSRRQKVPQISWEEFSGWSAEKQKVWLTGALAEARDNNVSMSLAAESSLLAGLLETPAARNLWEIVRSDRSNTLILAYENVADIPMAAIGGRFHVDRLQAESLQKAIGSPRFQRRYSEELRQGVVAAITDDETRLEDERILPLRRHPASLLFRLFLSRPDLRNLAQNAEFLDVVSGILADIENLEALLKSA